ncbi:hypothetical protein WMY93_024384 [Mugilogobius chulae]|uniref:Peptidase S1 domain-containing protein n=1 Tax=Mugilogobius chulae TaxID=88201 RepID=A0AAW0NBD2_9GOBI
MTQSVTELFASQSSLTNMQPAARTLLLLIALTAQDAVHTGKIFGGKVAHNKPYMVLVRGNAVCSYTVKLGLHHIKDTSNVQKIEVQEAFPITDYKDETLNNDISLLKLKSKAKLSSHVSTISVAEPGDPEQKSAMLQAGAALKSPPP